MENPLTDQKYKLEKVAGKGGWTYVMITEIVKDKNAHVPWSKVKGAIDDFEVRKCHLMSMGKGKFFLPVNAEIRKKIGKQEGDWVHVILFPDLEPLEIPEEMLLCLQDEPKALENFNSFTESEQKAYITWIYKVKSEEKKIDRLAKAVNKLLNGEKL